MANESIFTKAKRTMREVETGLMHWDESRRKKTAQDEIKAVEARIAAKPQSSVAEALTERDNVFEARRKKIERMTE